ncbi:MAG: GlsB/YeaQ/YmgE family stress response membrane protein [Rhizobiales bacterium]|nr:GlsB/YeaQ/YmgE family stress response membrane protein [Hyphomicrobiales bacterium]MBI3674640.1 GlsB/YeaQ/YmgE family stress response membrane protein [Hyphomicrobiales bacterium]
MDGRNIAIALVMGLIAGWIASLVVGGNGIIQYLVSGVLGSFVGSYILNRLGIRLGIDNEYVRDTLTAAIGAVIVVIIARLVV